MVLSWKEVNLHRYLHTWCAGFVCSYLGPGHGASTGFNAKRLAFLQKVIRRGPRYLHVAVSVWVNAGQSTGAIGSNDGGELHRFDC